LRVAWDDVSSHRKARIAELEERIADLKARLPRHSVPPAMFIELEELEEELERARGHAEARNPSG
jgi:hypothetical protein